MRRLSKERKEGPMVGQRSPGERVGFERPLLKGGKFPSLQILYGSSTQRVDHNLLPSYRTRPPQDVKTIAVQDLFQHQQCHYRSLLLLLLVRVQQQQSHFSFGWGSLRQSRVRIHLHDLPRPIGLLWLWPRDQNYEYKNRSSVAHFAWPHSNCDRFGCESTTCVAIVFLFAGR